MKKVGIFGGSFNPIHTGHIALAKSLCEKAGLDEVWFMVSPMNPFKKTATDLLDDHLRLEMVEKALEKEPQLKVEGDDLVIPEQKHYVVDSFIDGTIMTLADAPWPGLTPDLLSVLLVVATQARGSVLFHQKMFESRLFFVDKLIDMGAQIILCDPHRAVVVGHDHKIKLRAGRMTSPDIRAGIALLIAAMSANGTSRIANIAQIDRGYEDIEQRLDALGAKITRVCD